MDNRQAQQASLSGQGEETKPSTALAHSRPEQIRYLPMPAGATVVTFPPSFSDTILENRLAQAVTVDQQHELMQYVRRLNGWMESEVQERHDDLRRLRASFEQLGRDFRDLQDEESTSTSGGTLEKLASPPPQVLGTSANPPYPTVQRPVIPNQSQPLPVDPQPQPIVVMIPTMYAPRPIPAVPRRVRQLLPPPQQPAIRDSPEPPSFIPPGASEPGVRSSRPSTPGPVSIPPRSGISPNVVVIPESSSGSLRHGTPGGQNGRAHRQSMGRDVIVVPQSSASTRSTSPARGTSRLAQHGSVTSLRGRGVLQRTPSSRSQRSQTPLVVTNPPSPVPTGHTLPVPALSMPRLVRPAASQPIAVQQSPQPQHIIQRPLSVPMMPTFGPERIYEAEFPILRPPPGPMADTSFAPFPPISRPVTPVFMPRDAKGPKVATHPPAIIRQHSPVSRHRQAQTAVQAVQPPITKTSPNRLSKRRRPEPAMADPVPVVLPSQPIGRVPPPPQPEVILMPARTGSTHNRQNRRQIRSIDRPTFVPTPAVTAMTYSETDSNVRTMGQPSATPFIIPQRSPVSSDGAVIRRSSRHGPQPTTARQVTRPVVRQTSHSRSIRIGRVPPPQPEVILMPARTGSRHNRQHRRQIRSIDRPTFVPTPAVTAMTYSETDSHARTMGQPSATPFIIPQRSPVSSDGAVIRRSSRHGPQPTTARQVTRPVVRQTSHSRSTRIGRVPPPQPEVILMPARTRSRHNRQHRRQIRSVDRSTFVPTATVTAVTYPETDSHVRTTAQPSITPFIIPQGSPVSTQGDLRASLQPAEQPAVIRRSSRHRPQPATPIRDPLRRTSPSRLTRSHRPSIGSVPPPRQPEIVLMPARTESTRNRQNRRQLRPIDTSVGVPTSVVTAMAYPETVSHVRTTAQPSTTSLIVPQRSPLSSNSFRASVPQAAEQRPVVSIRTSPSRSSIRRGAQPTTAIPIPVVPASRPIGNIISSSGPGIVVMPARTVRSTDSSPVILSASQRGNDVESGVNTGSRSHSSLPQSGGAVVVPLDSEAEEAMGFRPPISRRPSFAGRDWISYDSRSSSTDSYSPQSPPVCVTPSFRGRSRSPHFPMSVTPTSRQQSQSPPRIYRPASTELWGHKSRTRPKQQGWYRSTESSPASVVAKNSLLQPPAAGRGGSNASRGETRSFRSERSDLERERTGIMLGPELKVKRSWMDNL